MSGNGEQSVLVGDETHQEKARHEDEWGPILCCGGPGVIGAEQRSGECPRTADGRQHPPEPTSGIGRPLRVRAVAHRCKHAWIRPGPTGSALPDPALHGLWRRRLAARAWYPGGSKVLDAKVVTFASVRNPAN